MKRIHIGGVYYGIHNVGDEAILTSIIKSFSEGNCLSVSSYNGEWIKNKFPEVYVKSIDLDYSKPKMGVYALPRRSILQNLYKIYKEKRFYSEKDLYICGGATILSDCPWYSLRTVKLCKSTGTNTILFGVGMAEIKDRNAIYFIKKICDSLDDIYVRDKYVKQRLTDIGIDDSRIKICYDPALLLEPNINILLEDYLNDKGIEKYNDDSFNIGITLSGEDDIINKTPVEDIKQIIKYYIEKYNANIFLIPTNTRPGQDIDLMKKLVINDKTILVDKEFTPEDLIAFMKNFRFTLSSRLHMNILSSIVGTPSIGLVRNSKIVDFANLLNLKYYELENINIRSIERYSDYIILNNESIRENILIKVEKMRNIHMQCIQKIKKKYL